MLRLFVALNLFLLNLYACKGGYDTCIQKVKDSKTIRGKALYIPVKNHKLLVYSETKPSSKIYKYDPFLSLYLIKDKDKFPYPFDINMMLQLGTAAVNNKKSSEGKIVKRQVGLNSLAIYKSNISTPALITSSCCSLEGIITSKGMIEKEYIRRFLTNKSADYADIGVRVQNSTKCVKIVSSNPYIKNNKLQKGDCILSLDGRRVSSAYNFMTKILFSKIGSIHTIKARRGSKVFIVKIKSFKRCSGGNISETFLEQKGIYFDNSLHILKISNYLAKYGVIVGDQLLQIDGISVKNQDELRSYIEEHKDLKSLLFERDKFQFFINMNVNNHLTTKTI